MPLEFSGRIAGVSFPQGPPGGDRLDRLIWRRLVRHPAAKSSTPGTCHWLFGNSAGKGVAEGESGSL